MKNIYLLILCIGACIQIAPGKSKVILENAVRIGNVYENSGRFVNLSNEINKILISGVTAGNTDFGLSGIPRAVNANTNQDIFMADFNTSLDSANYAVNLDGNGYDFINEIDVHKSSYEALYGGKFNGTINVLTKKNVCGSAIGSCGFLAKSNTQGQFTDFKQFESTGNISVTDVKWTKGNDFAIGLNYTGTFTHGTNNVTALGRTDAYIASASDFESNPKWSVNVSASIGYVFLDCLNYNPFNDEIISAFSVEPFGQTGNITYTANDGFTTTIFPTNWQYNDMIITMEASNGHLKNYTLIGSPSNFNIENVFTTSDQIYIGGSARGELYPDQDNPFTKVSNFGGPDMVELIYYQNLKYKKAFNPSGMGDDLNFRSKFISAPLHRLQYDWGDGVVVQCGAKTVNTTKSALIKSQGNKADEMVLRGFLYILDKDLNPLDSLILRGPGMSEIYDADMDSLGNLYITGDFLGTIDFDQSDTEFNLTSDAGSRDMFIAKYDVSSVFATSLASMAENSFLKIYPVPAREKVFVEANFKKSSSGIIQFEDISGRVLLQKQFTDETALRREIPLQMASGIILVKIKTQNESLTKKFIVQR